MASAGSDAGQGSISATGSLADSCANPIAYGGDEELDKPCEDRSTLPIENQSFVSSGDGVFIPAFSFPGFDSIPGGILAKHRPKVPTALRGLLAEPLLKQDR